MLQHFQVIDHQESQQSHQYRKQYGLSAPVEISAALLDSGDLVPRPCGVDQSPDRMAVHAAELAGLGYSLSNIKAGVTLALKGYNEKQGVLLDKIMEKLAGFTVDEKRFHVLKEAYARGLKNFQAEQPHQHAVYYNSVVLSERVWHKEELMSALERLTVEEVTEFIPRLLGRLV